MDLFETLKQFKIIKPDEAFTEKSRRAILASSPLGIPGVVGIFKAQRFIFRIVEMGAALALAGLFIVLIMGGFSGSAISPVRFSAIDPQTLRAEAQEIDAQIELASLNYSEPALVAESTQKLAAAIGEKSAVAAVFSTVSTSTAISTSTVSIDQALEALSK
jgi:hypothetical protein